jgi:hypothetical protein
MQKNPANAPIRAKTGKYELAQLVLK